MEIAKLNNQPNFGVRCINTKSWNKDVLQKFEQSQLVQEIDAKYPNASSNYFFFKQNDIANDENIWTTLFDIILKPDKIWHFRLDSHIKEVPDIYLGRKLETASLKDIENEIIEQKINNNWTTPMNIMQVTKEEINPIKRFFNKLFHKD